MKHLFFSLHSDVSLQRVDDLRCFRTKDCKIPNKSTKWTQKEKSIHSSTKLPGHYGQIHLPVFKNACSSLLFHHYRGTSYTEHKGYILQKQSGSLSGHEILHFYILSCVTAALRAPLLAQLTGGSQSKLFAWEGNPLEGAGQLNHRSYQTQTELLYSGDSWWQNIWLRSFPWAKVLPNRKL